LNAQGFSSSRNPPRHAHIPRRRWRIAWLLGVGVLVNFFDRVNLSVSHDSLIAAFGISDVVFGYLSSSYNWTYALCQLPIGVALDKLGVRRVGRIGTFIWSAASFAASAAPNLSAFFGARFLLGVGEAPTFPSNAKAIGLWFPQSERSFATSLNDSAAKFASAIGIPVIGIVLIHAGWRWSFAFTGAISLAYFLLFWRVYRDPDEDPKLTEIERLYIEDEPASLAAPGQVLATPGQVEGRASSLGQLLSQRKVLGLALGFGAYNYVFFLLLYWLPAYLSSALHIDLLHSFIYTSVPWFVATATDLAFGGFLVDFLVQRGFGQSAVRRTVLIGGTAFGLGILGAAHAQRFTGPHLDHRLAQRSCRGRTCGLVAALLHRTPSRCGQSRRDHQFLRPGLGDCGLHPHRLPGHRVPLLRGSVCSGRRLPRHRHRGVSFPAGPDRAAATRARCCVSRRQGLIHARPHSVPSCSLFARQPSNI
jgi:MFS family permease